MPKLGPFLSSLQSTSQPSQHLNAFVLHLVPTIYTAFSRFISEKHQVDRPLARILCLLDKRMKMASFTTTEWICGTCRRMNIESLTSPDGFLHTRAHRLASKFCPLCKDLFSYPVTDKPFRLKISPHTYRKKQRGHKVEWGLMVEWDSEDWVFKKLVATQEGRYRDAFDRTMILKHP
jgi:hypothetical protein